MARSILSGAVFALLAGAAPQAVAQYADGYGDIDDRMLRCESTDGRQRYCPADTRGGVRLVRQMSKAPCVQGTTWNSDGRGIWVDQGCRGEFMLERAGWGNGGSGATGQTFRCESRDGRWQQCATDARRVELVRQLSDKPCIRGRTWGTDARGVWVSGGCRAEFSARGQGGWGNSQPQIVRCESPDGRQRTCPTAVRGDVRLLRQLSRTPCVEGQTWGVGRDGIWVDRGCRAEFEVAARRRGR